MMTPFKWLPGVWVHTIAANRHQVVAQGLIQQITVGHLVVGVLKYIHPIGLEVRQPNRHLCTPYLFAHGALPYHMTTQHCQQKSVDTFEGLSYHNPIMKTLPSKKLYRPTFSPKEKCTFYLHPRLAKKIHTLAATEARTLSDIAEEMLVRGLGWKVGRMVGKP